MTKKYRMPANFKEKEDWIEELTKERNKILQEIKTPALRLAEIEEKLAKIKAYDTEKNDIRKETIEEKATPAVVTTATEDIEEKTKPVAKTKQEKPEIDFDALDEETKKEILEKLLGK